jgi:hypothetical protein
LHLLLVQVSNLIEMLTMNSYVREIASSLRSSQRQS